MRRNKYLKLILAVIVSCFILIVLLFVLLLTSRVKKEALIQVGQEASADDFRRYEWDKGNFTWLDKPDTTIAGERTGTIQVFPFTYKVTLWVQTTGTEAEHTSTITPEPTIYVDNTTVVEKKNVKEVLVMELGEELPEAEEFLLKEGNEVSFITNMSYINPMEEGNYDISLYVDGKEEVSSLQIKDTVPPVLVLHTNETWLNKPLEVSSFIDYDASGDNSNSFETSFETEPDWTLEGEQSVTVIAADSAGNSTRQTTMLLIKRDKKAPVVTVTDIDIKVGGTVSYKKAVSFFDDIDSKEEMKLSIERSTVNLKEVGTYEVTYTVTDCSGNSTSVVGKINVLEEAAVWENEEAIHEKAREILDSILKDGMTEREKAKAIYRWIKSHVGYIDHSEKGNYMRGAYEGLFKREGDCFVFASTAKELLTLAEIPNIDIVKATINPSHYWNLVYIEDGWYHFDSTPRHDKSEFFLLTDAELEAYSSSHRNTHIFDRSLYPEIK